MKQKPNIVLILTDDQGEWALGCSGNTDIKTPCIDALAQNGIRFENFFCASPVCSPARASLLTGRIPSGHGIQDWLRGGNINIADFPHLQNDPIFESEHKAIPYLEGQTTYTDLLQANGYTCSLAGKWHMGDSVHPQHGFSNWFTIARGGCEYYHADCVQDGEIHFESRYITDLITDHAIEDIHALAQAENPFYLSVHYTAPHSPWDAANHPQEYLDLYRDCQFTQTPDLPMHPWQDNTAPCGTGEKRKELLRGYYAAVSAMDANVQRIVDTLAEKQLLDNTIIIFTSDNGMNMGHHGVWGKGNGTFPQNMYDSSVKVPFIISCPALLPRGRVCSAMVSQYDFLPTLADYLNIDIHHLQNLPGKSFASILHGELEPQDETVVIFDEYGPVRMIRNREWKLVRRYPYGPNELYHLAKDPQEERNLYNNPAYAEQQQTLTAQLEKWFVRYVNPEIDAVREPITGKGQLSRVGIYAEGKSAHAEVADYQRER